MIYTKYFERTGHSVYSSFVQYRPLSQALTTGHVTVIVPSRLQKRLAPETKVTIHKLDIYELVSQEESDQQDAVCCKTDTK